MLRDYLRVNKKQLQFLAGAGLAKIVYSDGMPQSGSTLLFNIARLVLQSNHGCKVSAGWVGDALDLPPADIYLIKTHGIKPLDAWRAHRFFHSFRDPRDALVSGLRKIGTQPTIEPVRAWMKWYAFAEKRADLMCRYETMIEDIPGTIRAVAGALGQMVDVDDIAKSIPMVAPDRSGTVKRDKVTLMHRNHRTGTVAGEWRDIFPPALQRQISSEIGPWLERNGYPLD